MTLKQIDIFLAVTELGSIKLAAEYLYMSPSSLSRQLSLLEAELNLHLFVRGNNSICPTEGGRIFARACRSVREELNDAVEKARIMEEGAAGQLSIGFANESYWPDALIEFVEHFDRTHPNIHVNYSTVPLTGFENNLKKFSTDLVIAHNLLHDASLSPVISSVLIGVAEAGIFYSDRFPLAKKEPLTIPDLEGQTMYIRDTKYLGNIQKLKDFYGLKDLKIEIVNSTPQIYIDIRLGHGVSIMDPTILGKFPDSFHCIPVDRNVVHGELRGYWNRENLNYCLPIFLKEIEKNQLELKFS